MPGEYRVVAMLNKQPSRNHIVTVRANAETTVEIDAKLDQAVHTIGYTGLSFATPEARDDTRPQYAAKFATAVGANAVAVVGIDKVRGKSAVVGTLVSLQSGREIRRASIPVEPDPSTERLRALARFLGGEEPAPGLDVKFSSEEDTTSASTRSAMIAKSVPRRRARRRSGRWGGWRWITAGLAVAGLVGGGYATYLDGRCNGEPPPAWRVGSLCDAAVRLSRSGCGRRVRRHLDLSVRNARLGRVCRAASNGGAVAGYSLRLVARCCCSAFACKGKARAAGAPSDDAAAPSPMPPRSMRPLHVFRAVSSVRSPSSKRFAFVAKRRASTSTGRAHACGGARRHCRAAP